MIKTSKDYRALFPRNSKGVFVRVHKVVSQTCACGSVYETTEGRLAQGRGRYCSKKCLYTYRPCRSGQTHHNWKGEYVSYSSLHKWIKSKLGRPFKCEFCGETKKRLHWSNISGEYYREFTDWQQLCVSCHGKFDKRLKNKSPEIRRLVAWQKVI